MEIEQLIMRADAWIGADPLTWPTLPACKEDANRLIGEMLKALEAFRDASL